MCLEGWDLPCIRHVLDGIVRGFWKWIGLDYAVCCRMQEENILQNLHGYMHLIALKLVKQ